MKVIWTSKLIKLSSTDEKRGPHFNVLWTLIDNVRATKQNPTANIHERYWNVIVSWVVPPGGLSRVLSKHVFIREGTMQS